MAKAGAHAGSDSESSGTDPEMPPLLPVRATVEGTAGVASNGETRNWGAIEALIYESVEGLNEVAKHNKQLLRLFNRYLRARHRVWINRIDENEDTGSVSVAVDEKQPAPSRRCCLDGTLWTLGETLQWTLNERNASVDWTLKFWDRDFEH